MNMDLCNLCALVGAGAWKEAAVLLYYRTFCKASNCHLAVL